MLRNAARLDVVATLEAWFARSRRELPPLGSTLLFPLLLESEPPSLDVKDNTVAKPCSTSLVQLQGLFCSKDAKVTTSMRSMSLKPNSAKEFMLLTAWAKVR